MKAKLIVMTAIAVWFGSAVNVEAEPAGIDVKIRSYEGESVAVMADAPLYSSTPVTLIPEAEGEISYSVSVDGGKNFGGYAQMEDDGITLYPDDDTSPDGIWHIRFRTGKEDSELFSDTYKIVFDRSAPVIDFADPEKIEDGAGAGKCVHFSISDDCGICRMIVKSGDKTIKELHAEAAEILKHYDLELALDDPDDEAEHEIVCFDLAGNSSVISFSYKVDTKAPEVSVQGISDGAKIREDAKLSVSAKDDGSRAFIGYVITRTTDDEIITKEAEGIADSVTLGFDEDGEYSVEVYAVDAASNRSERIKRSFLIDRESPHVSIEGVADSVDSRGEVSAAIDIEEKMHEHTKVNISLTRTMLGKTEIIPISEYELAACHDIRMVNISTDGDYEMRVDVTDAAGNTSSAAKRFRVDSTAPDIAIEGPDEGVITNTKPVLRFSAAEMFYDSAIMTALLEKKENDGYVKVLSSNHVMTSVRDHVDICAEDEGEYRLTCIASDRSGNKKSSALSFTVDYTPPAICDLSDIDNKVFRSFSLPQKIAQMARDATGAYVRAFANDKELKDDDVILGEGHYMLTIIAEDAARNASEKTASFIVDHTSPQIVLTGFDRDGNVKKGTLVKVSLLEPEDRLLSVSWQGRNVAIGDDNTAYVAADGYGQYRLSVKAEDDAGNVTDTEISTNCYMLGAAPDVYTKKLSSLVADPDTSDVDVGALCIGLLSVLTGTFGLTYRTITGECDKM